MHFQFYDDLTGDGWPITTPVVGYNVTVDDQSDGRFTEVHFTISELRQMLDEAVASANEESLANCDCGLCSPELYAPLADEQELADDFVHRVNLGDESSMTFTAGSTAPTVRRDYAELLEIAEESLHAGDASEAKAYIELAYAKRDLLS